MVTEQEKFKCILKLQKLKKKLQILYKYIYTVTIDIHNMSKYR